MREPCTLGLGKILLVLATIPLCFASQHAERRHKTQSTSVKRAKDGLDAAMLWYNKTTGRWGDDNVIPWWQSGIMLQDTLDFMSKTGSRDYMAVAKNTIEIQRAPVPWWPEGEGEFRADSTDDTGWWALACVNMYELTGEKEYLDIAKLDEAYMYSYSDNGTCGGGILWDVPSRSYNNAISNGLYLLLTASLHNAIPGDKFYLSRALAEWKFYKNSGMINSQHLVNDGLTENNSTCVNNQRTTWTYNQGVLIGGLAELYKATKDKKYLKEARKIGDAVLSSPLLVKNGILTESCEADDSCDQNQPAFKGIFTRYLSRFNDLLSDQPYTNFLEKQAESVWANDRNASNFYSVHWAGPLENVTIASQTSALALLISVL